PYHSTRQYSKQNYTFPKHKILCSASSLDSWVRSGRDGDENTGEDPSTRRTPDTLSTRRHPLKSPSFLLEPHAFNFA
ncbi:hypothetical protein V5O48_014881, partial [Marasmius crinis-equi]